MREPKDRPVRIARKRDPAFQVLIPEDDLADYHVRARHLGVPLGMIVRDLLAGPWPIEERRNRKKSTAADLRGSERE